ncbi:uncharacterized protein LOC142554524 [Primulina tabacum]|uniref:uncharacterized protein LOC142554524 n=1 Tax=Primulina tabacum TaxID=48773 RepID=UPI003F590BE2
MVRMMEMFDITLWMKSKLNRKDFEFFATRTYAVWMERLRTVHNNDSKKKMINVEWCETMLCGYQEARTSMLISASTREHISSPSRWIAPPINQLRLDVDAAYNVNSNRYAIDCVVRNHEGQTLLAFGKQITKPPSIVSAELIAIEEGFQMTQTQNLRINQITSDSLMAVQAVTSPAEDFGYTGAFATKIRNLLANHAHLKLEHVLCTANGVAHSLASFAISSPSPFMWNCVEFPVWLVKLIIEDLIPF